MYISYVNPSVLDPFGRERPHYVITAQLSKIDGYKMSEGIEHKA